MAHRHGKHCRPTPLVDRHVRNRDQRGVVVHAAWASAVVANFHHAQAVQNVRIDRPLQANNELLSPLESAIVVDHERHRLDGLAGGERQRARIRGVVGHGGCRAVLTDVSHHDSLRRRSRHRDRCRDDASSLVDHHIVDGDVRRGRCVHDRCNASSSRVDRRAGGDIRRQSHRFIHLVQRVIDHRGAHQHAGGARRERRRRGTHPSDAAVGRDLQVRPASRAVVHTATGSRDVSQTECDLHRSRGRVRKARREHGEPSRFRNHDVADRQLGAVIIGSAGTGAVIKDRAQARRNRNRRVARGREVHTEILSPLVGAVVCDRNRDRPAGLPWSKRQRAAGRGVVDARQRSTVSRRVVHRDRNAGRAIQAHREGSRAGVLVDGHTVDREGRRVVVRAAGTSAVVIDHALPDRLSDRRIRGRRQVDKEALRQFQCRVLVDLDAQGLAHFTGGERDRASLAHIVQTVGGRPRTSRKRNRHRHVRRPVHRDRESGRADGFIDVQAVDRNGRGIVIRATRTRTVVHDRDDCDTVGNGRIHRSRQIQQERLRPFEDGIVGDRNIDSGRRLTRSKGQRATGSGVVSPRTGSTVGRRVVHRHRHGRRIAQGNRDRDRARSFVDNPVTHDKGRHVVVEAALPRAVIQNGSNAGAIDDDAVDGRTQDDVEILGTLENAVLQDRNLDGDTRLARGKCDNPGRRGVVHPHQRRVVSRRVIHRNRHGGKSHQTHCE